LADLFLENDDETQRTDPLVFDLNKDGFISTTSLPNIKGTGLVYDAFIKYNTDEDFKKLALDFGTDISKTATNFEEYLAQWSGFE
jgi:hypothetical protein